jgi:organic radical activating enzyme
MSRIFLDRVEFYITNVCNLNCDNCNRFNNYHFTGHQKWEDYREIYEEWGKKINFNHISILGGEPLLNPSIIDWSHGIGGIWKARIEIVTNGTRLLHVKGLYDEMKGYGRGQIFIHVGLHDGTKLAEMEEMVLKFLKGPVEREEVFENNTTHYRFIDSNDVWVEIHVENIFHRNALTRNNSIFTIHDSNTTKAHDICYEKHNHHFVKGKLYKCNVTGVLPEFHKQFYLNMSLEDKKLMDSYRPLTLDDDLEFTKSFINNLPNEVSQCKFCPEWLDSFPLIPSTQKIKVEKKP